MAEAGSSPAPRVLVPLYPGCEEIEAVTVVDVLRRAGCEVVTAGREDGPVTASRGVVLLPDQTLGALSDTDFQAIVLPGGLGGSEALAADPRIESLLREALDAGRLVGAICAAPAVVLAPLGVLGDRRATCYPALAEKLPVWVDEPVVLDGNLVTSQGPGTALAFSLALVEVLCGPDTAREVGSAALVR